MIRKSLLPAALAALMAVPALAGVPTPDLPRLDFGTPVHTCTPPQVCDPDQ